MSRLETVLESMSRPMRRKGGKTQRSCTEPSKTRGTKETQTCNSATADDVDKAHDASGAGGARCHDGAVVTRCKLLYLGQVGREN